LGVFHTQPLEEGGNVSRDLVSLISLSATLGLLLVLGPGERPRPAVLAGAAIPPALAAPLDVQAGARVCLPLILYQATAGGTVCYDNDACDPGGYCHRPPGICTSAGRCAPRPDACTADWTPVCACDGRTYSNACTAAAAGENVAYEGECAGR
jgi:hypothetical protein